MKLFRSTDPNHIEMVIWAAVTAVVVTLNFSGLITNFAVKVTLFVIYMVSINGFFSSWMLPEIGGTTIFPLRASIRRWWQNFSAPATIGEFEGRSVLERWDLLDFRSIYNADGWLIATEQEIDWSSTDPDWQYGEPRVVQFRVERHSEIERLPWLARLRSPKIPTRPLAEVTNPDGARSHVTYTVD